MDLAALFEMLVKNCGPKAGLFTKDRIAEGIQMALALQDLTKSIEATPGTDQGPQAMRIRRMMKVLFSPHSERSEAVGGLVTASVTATASAANQLTRQFVKCLTRTTGSRGDKRMLRNVMSSRVALGIFSLAALFFGLVGYANPEVLIIALNGIFTGCMVAIVVLTID